MPVNKALCAKGEFVKFLVFLFFVFFSSVISASEDVLGELLKYGKWIKPTSTCPADVIEQRNDSLEYISDLCNGKVKNCLDQCRKGNFEYCYNLALKLQLEKHEVPDSYAEELYLETCRLGGISGCTNRAASFQLKNGEEFIPCAVRTYKKSCELDDPWSCTMYASHLFKGKGVDKDNDKALEALEKSCKYGEEDEACQYAVKIREAINSENGAR